MGVLELGLELKEEFVVDCGESLVDDHIRLMGGDRGLFKRVGDPGKLSPDDNERLNWVKLRLGGSGEPSCSARLLLSLRNNEVLRFLSSLLWR